MSKNIAFGHVPSTILAFTISQPMARLFFKSLSCTKYHLFFFQVAAQTQREKEKNKDTKNSLRLCIHCHQNKYQGTKYKVPNTMDQGVLLFQTGLQKQSLFLEPPFKMLFSLYNIRIAHAKAIKKGFFCALKPQNSLLGLKNKEKKHFFAQKFGGSKKRDVFVDNPIFVCNRHTISKIYFVKRFKK